MLRSVLFAAAFASSQAFSFPTAFKLSPGVDTRGFRGGLHLCKMTAAEPKVVVFTQEMRQAAMSLHTFSQAPKEGKVKDVSSETQVEQWQTTKEDFLQFLVDSKVVYEAFEKAVERPELQSLKNTGEIQDCKLFRLSSSSELFFSGLERVRVLGEDISYITDKSVTLSLFVNGKSITFRK